MRKIFSFLKRAKGNSPEEADFFDAQVFMLQNENFPFPMPPKARGKDGSGQDESKKNDSYSHEDFDLKYKRSIFE